jgi:2,3-bisphosphoglycerate-dependent phosphoglycerate mutase
MIIAHSNSLRAIVKILDQLSDNEVMSLNIPTGVPIMYEFDSDFIVKNKEFLIDQKSLNSKIDIVKKQGEIV